MILSSSGVGPALPVARRLRLAGGGDELRMPAVEEERQVGMAAPGLDAPGDDRLEVAGGCGGRPACLAPPRSWRRCRTGAIAARSCVPARVITGRASPSTMILMVNGLPSGVIHLSPALAEAGLLQQLLRRLRIGLPPAAAERLGDLVRDRSGSGRPSTGAACRRSACRRRIVGLDLALAGIDLEVLQPGFHRLVIAFGCVPVGGTPIAEIVAAPR